MHFTFTLRPRVFFHMCCNYWNEGEIWREVQLSASQSPLMGASAVCSISLAVGLAASKFHSRTLMFGLSRDKPRRLGGAAIQQSTRRGVMLLVCLCVRRLQINLCERRRHAEKLTARFVTHSFEDDAQWSINKKFLICLRFSMRAPYQCMRYDCCTYSKVNSSLPSRFWILARGICRHLVTRALVMLAGW